MSAYTIEYSVSGRAKCKGPCKCLIEKGTLRFGTISEVPGFGDGASMSAWRHFPACVTQKVAKNALAKGPQYAVPPADRAQVEEALKNIAEGQHPASTLPAGTKLEGGTVAAVAVPASKGTPEKKGAATGGEAPPAAPKKAAGGKRKAADAAEEGSPAPAKAKPARKAPAKKAKQ